MYAPGSAAAALTYAQEPAGLSLSPPLQVAGSAQGDLQQFQNLQQKVLTQGDAIARSFGDQPTGVVKIVSWMVRATFLDARIGRMAAADVNGTGAAIAAVAITAAPGLLLGSLIASGLGFRMSFLAGFISTVIVMTATWGITLFVLSALAPKVVDAPLSFGTVLRVLAYAQTANVLISIPLLGNLIGPIARIWSIIATAVAIREVTRTRTEKAVIFAAIGALVYALAWMTLSIIAARTAMALHIR